MLFQANKMKPLTKAEKLEIMSHTWNALSSVELALLLRPMENPNIVVREVARKCCHRFSPLLRTETSIYSILFRMYQHEKPHSYYTGLWDDLRHIPKELKRCQCWK